VYGFVWPAIVALGDTRLEVYDPDIYSGPTKLPERIAPDVFETDRSRNRAIGALGELDVIASIAHP
jgi:hypothetical protein